MSQSPLHSIALRIKAPKRWRTLLALALMLSAILTNFYSLLAIMFLWWLVPAIHFGEFHFVEKLSAKQDPAVFWLVILGWITISLLIIFWDVYLIIRFFYFY